MWAADAVRPMIWTIIVVSILIAVWLLAPGPENRYSPLTERQQARLDRLTELDRARADLWRDLGREPTADELWMVSPPKMEGN